MGTELAALIKADLAQLTNEANRMVIQPAVQANDQGGVSFAQSMKDAIAGVDAQNRAASNRMADVDSGKSDDLVGAMLASQEASLSFSMLMQVRNKVMGAVDELLKLPV